MIDSISFCQSQKGLPSAEHPVPKALFAALAVIALAGAAVAIPGIVGHLPPLAGWIGGGAFVLAVISIVGVAVRSRRRLAPPERGTSSETEQPEPNRDIQKDITVEPPSTLGVFEVLPFHKFASLDRTALTLKKSFNDHNQIPFIYQYGDQVEPCYAHLVIRLPCRYLNRFPEWIQKNCSSATPELYFLVVEDNRNFPGQKRNLSFHHMLFPDYKEGTWADMDVEIALSDPSGVQPYNKNRYFQDIFENRFHKDAVLIHGPGLCFSPDNMRFNLLDQEICQGFFTLKTAKRVAIFHIVILRPAHGSGQDSAAINHAINQSATVEEFVQTVEKGTCSQKDQILQTLRVKS
jgi:hypothetical protein